MPPNVPISVLMPVYNVGRFLRPTLDSILRQSHADFELLVIDDGSSDGSSELLRGIVDPRLRLVRHASNRGITASRQEALELARGRYLAWADADDLSRPDRLLRQLELLERRSEVVLVGSAAQVIDETGRPVGWLGVPTDPQAIRWASLLTNPFITSSVMMRGETIRRHGLTFDPDCRLAQDFDLWTKLLRHGQGVNLDMPLVSYRMHSSNQTSRNRTIQLRNHDRIVLRTIREVLPEFGITDAAVIALRQVVNGESGTAAASQRALAGRYLEMFAEFCQAHGSSRPLRREAAWVLARRFRLLGQALALDPGLPIQFLGRVMRRIARRVLA